MDAANRRLTIGALAVGFVAALLTMGHIVWVATDEELATWAGWLPVLLLMLSAYNVIGPMMTRRHRDSRFVPGRVISRDAPARVTVALDDGPVLTWPVKKAPWLDAGDQVYVVRPGWMVEQEAPLVGAAWPMAAMDPDGAPVLVRPAGVAVTPGSKFAV